MSPVRKRPGLSSAQIYSAFVEAVDDLVYVVDREGRYAMFNRRGLEECGFRQEDVIGRTPVEAFGPAMGRPFMRNNAQVISSGKPLALQEWIAIKGVSRCYSTSLNPVLDAHGEVRAVIGISRDITDMKRMVEELQIGSERAKSMFRQRVHFEHMVREIVRSSITRHRMNDFLGSVISILGEGLEVSRSYFFLYDHERQTASNTHEWVAPGVEPTREMLQDVPIGAQPWWSKEMLAGRIVCLEDVSAAPSAELVELLNSTSVKSVLSIPIFVFGRPHGFIGFDQCDRSRRWDDVDIELLSSACRIVAQKIERSRLEEEMLGAERLAAMGRLSQVFAHEINNPLQGILLHLEALAGHVGEGGMGTYGHVLEGFKRISEIIGRLSEASRSKVEFAPVDVNEVLRSAFGLLSSKADRGINIRWFLDERLPRVSGDEKRLHQAALNILINALDSMQEGGELTISTSGRGEAVEIEVSDTGCGIEENDIPYLFEPFFTTKGRSGTGLGLFVSHSIVTEHGGNIQVFSAKGQGTAVRMTLPVGRKGGAK
ncbi:MAG: PAS domain-containing protein [Proteobacteria bacterium]|nr:PAS domain-containing protein [Pseudomonadota bacterium]